MKCPKCHFEQPQDNYCANCGIEIASYHPPKAKWTQKLFNQTVYISLGITVVAGVLIKTFLLSPSVQSNLPRSQHSNSVQLGSHHSESSKSADSTPAKNINPPENTLNPNQQTTSESASSELKTSSSNSNLGGQDSQLQIRANGALANLNSDTPNKNRPTSSSKSNLTVRIIYAEVNTNELSQIFEESQESGQFTSYGDHSAGVLLGYANKTNDKNSRIKSYYTEEKELELGKTQQWFVGANSPNDNSQIGLIFNLEWTGSEPNGRRNGSLEISRNWKDASDSTPPLTTHFPPIAFEVDKSSALFVSGIIPHRVVGEMEDKLASVEALKVLRFSPFLKQQTESFIIFEFLEK